MISKTSAAIVVIFGLILSIQQARSQGQVSMRLLPYKFTACPYEKLPLTIDIRNVTKDTIFIPSHDLRCLGKLMWLDSGITTEYPVDYYSWTPHPHTKVLPEAHYTHYANALEYKILSPGESSISLPPGRYKFRMVVDYFRNYVDLMARNNGCTLSDEYLFSVRDFTDAERSVMKRYQDNAGSISKRTANYDSLIAIVGNARDTELYEMLLEQLSRRSLLDGEQKAYYIIEEYFRKYRNSPFVQRVIITAGSVHRRADFLQRIIDAGISDQITETARKTLNELKNR